MKFLRLNKILTLLSCVLFPGAPILDTSPETNGCWQQAFYPLPKPIKLHRGSICTLKVKAYKDQLLCALRDIVIPEDPEVAENGGQPCSCNNNNSTSLKDNDTSQESEIEKDEDSTLPSKRTKHVSDTSTSMIISYKNYASPDTIIVLPNNDFALMNDNHLIQFFNHSLADIQRKQEILNQDRNFCILDITNLGALSIALVNAFPGMQFSCYNNDALKLVHLFSRYVHKIGAFPDNQGYLFRFFFPFSQTLAFEKVLRFFGSVSDSLLTDGSTTESGCPLISSKPPRTNFEVTFLKEIVLSYNFFVFYHFSPSPHF